MDYILYFFLFSFFGWILESIYALFVYKKFVSKQTLLKSPLCPIYGVGALVLIAALTPVKKSALLVFCGGFLTMSAVEYLVAVYYEHLYGVKWWDYTDVWGNFNGKVCVKLSLFWGVASVLFFKFLLPFAQMLVGKIDWYTKLISVVLCLFLFLRDYKNTLREIKKYSMKEKSLADDRFVSLKRINC